MASAASPIDIATPRNSPPVKTSNLTAQFQAEAQHRQSIGQNLDVHRRGSELRPESFGMAYGSPYHSGPISMGERRRRESNNLAGSLMGGMSWGGLSVGSFIRDDILMSGTSPSFQSPSFHSSSYLPKMEANFMKDYICCGITLDSLHDLLQHYEEAHAGVPNQTMGKTPKDQQTYSEGRPADASNAAALMQEQQGTFSRTSLPQGNMQASGLSSGLDKDSLNANGDMDDLDAMEMDDTMTGPPVQTPQLQYQPQPQFGRQQPRAPALNTSVANTLQGQQGSSPSTPQPNQSFNLHNNPTVSSVNTPAFAQTTSNLQRNPGDLDIDYGNVDTPRAPQGEFDLSTLNLGMDSSGTIDDPAKRLLSRQGFGGQRSVPTSPSSASNSELAKRLREQQLMSGGGYSGLGFGAEEVKPFKCPVIGCEKAYKNQNGLKYHKTHGHQNQKLTENPDGTFSIVDPATSIPYPGTVGMEKEKPYRCEVCGKRYKNLNGLKYHRQHSPPCNPELKFDATNMPATGNLQGMNVNVAGAGLVGDSLGF